MPNLLSLPWSVNRGGYRVINVNPSELEKLARNYGDIPSEKWASEAFQALNVDERAKHVLLREYKDGELWEDGPHLVAAGDLWREYDLADDYPGLFMEFAYLGDSPEELEEFANQYGSPSVLGEIVTPMDEIYSARDGLRKGIKIWEECKKSGDIRPFVKMVNDWVRSTAVNTPFISFKLETTAYPEKPTLKFEIDDFYGTLWFQLAQAASAQTGLKKCLWCTHFFEYGTGTGRRRSAHYCSNKCKQAWHRHNRNMSQ